MREIILCLCAVLQILSGYSRPLLADTLLASPATMLRTAQRLDFVGANRYSVEKGPFGRCLRSRPLRSASGLYLPINVSRKKLFHVRWSWRVDKIHKSADVTKRSHEDFAAMVAFVFGKPTPLNRDVPSLAYVWTSTPVPDGTIIRPARFDNARFVQLHGPRDCRSWQTEHRNVIADFKAAFGYAPGPLRFIAIFNDNDQTGEPVSAVFAPIFSEIAHH